MASSKCSLLSAPLDHHRLFNSKSYVHQLYASLTNALNTKLTAYEDPFILRQPFEKSQENP